MISRREHPEDRDGVRRGVAVDGGAVVAHVMFSRMTGPWRALGMAPGAVSPERRRAGSGRLVREGRAIAKAEGRKVVVVFGAPAHYRRFGFDPALAADLVSP